MNPAKISLRSRSAGSLTAITLLHCPLALGQAVSATAAALDEIVVTAQKRTENIQDVPITIQVMTGDDIARAGFRNLQDLATSTPTLRAQKGPSGDVIAIRGVQAPTGPSFEQAVGIFIDGIYYGRSRGARAGFLDLGRAEILKGPQSTYFGNNTIAGAYNIVTADPGDTFSGHAIANYEPVADEKGVEVSVGGPVNDTMGLRLAASFSKMEGWVDNDLSGPGPGTEDKTYRLTYTWAPGDALDFNLKLGGYDIKGVNTQGLELLGCPVQAPFTANGRSCTLALQGFPGLDTALNWKSVNNPLANAQEGRNAVLNANYRFGAGYLLTSVTGWWDFDYNEMFDQDYGPVYFAHTNNTEESSQFSQELRLASPDDRRFSYMLGAYAHKHKHDVKLRNGSFLLSLTPGQTAALAPLIPVGTYPVQIIASDFEEESASVFVAGTFRFTAAVRATVGVRRIEVIKETFRQNSMAYSNDLKVAQVTAVPAANQQAVANAFLPAGSLFALSLDLKQSDTLPSLNVQWDVAADKMLYFTIAKGFQAGGFDEAARTLTTNMAFGEETVVSSEIGLKAQWLDGRLTTNLGVFHAKYSDLQRSAVFLPPGSNIVANVVSAVGEQISRGVEVEARWRVTDRLDLNLNATRLSSKFGDDVTASCSQTQTFLQGSPCIVDLNGVTVVGAADYSGELMARYRQPVGGNFELSLQGSLFFTDDYELDGSFDPRGHQDAYQRLGARLAFGPGSGDWEVALVGRNLTDEKIKMTCGPVAGANGSYGCLMDRRHSYLLQGNYRF